MASPRRESQDTFRSPTALSPAGQYPFPAVDVPHRPYAARGVLRRGSTASSISSIGGALDGTSRNTESIPELGQNAISTLLQHPIVRTGLQAHPPPSSSGYKAPTSRDIPPVALTNIPHIEAKTFHPYLAQVGSLYEAFQRAKNESEEDAPLFQRVRKGSKAEEWDAVLNKQLQRPGHGRTRSTASSVTSPLEAPKPKRRQSGQKWHTVTPLSTIPAVYSEEDFHLENPRTFDIVSEHSELIRDPKAAPTGRKSLATNAILQEKLSWYMDTVEVHLISSISTASKSFFSALGSLRELYAEAADSIDRIQRLRKDLAKLDQEMALDGLKVVNLKRRRNNVRKLAQSIMQLEDIVAAVKACEMQVETDKIDDALDNLDDVERLMGGKMAYNSKQDAKERYTPRDLRSIRALEGALDDLNQLRFRVGRGFEGRFHSSLLGDIRRHVEKTDTKVTLERWGAAFNRPKPGQRRAPSTFPGYMNVGNELRLELESEMRGLNRARHTTPATTAFRALVLREMRQMIRRQLPSSNDDDALTTMSASTHGGRSMSSQEKSSILARNLRALDAEDWYKMLATIYCNTSEALRRLSVQVKILLDITSNLPDPTVRSPSATPEPGSIDQMTTPRQGQNRPRATSTIQAEVQQALDLSSLLGDGVDLIQNQLTKVVRVRTQQNADLDLDEFLSYFTLNRLFADECEALSGHTGAGLKSALDSQIKDYVSNFGERQKSKLVGVLDSDKWDAKDFGDRETNVLARVQNSSTDDAPAWSRSLNIWQASNLAATTNGTITNGTATPTGKVRSALVDEQRYLLPESATATLLAIEHFQHLACGIPSMSSEIASSLLDTLKLFSSRSSQLILGAGATRTAGLKNITTKHLALSSQALSFVIALIPYIREFFRRHLPSSSAAQTMSDFDSVKRRFQDHQTAIHEKLVEIMAGRSQMHIRTFNSIDWEAQARDEKREANAYMETLCKETATLAKVLSKHLPEGAVMGIMGPVFAQYRSQWERAFSEVRVGGEGVKER